MKPKKRNQEQEKPRLDQPYRLAPWKICIGLGVLILIFFANSFTAALLFDSESIIKFDPRIRAVNPVNVEQILTRDYWFPTQESVLYRPLTTFSYMFNYAILGNGENVFGYHVVNFLLHWANACLVLLIVRRLAGHLDIALLTACLFAVHPVNTEAVTNVVGRADLLSAFCVLLAGWSCLRAEIRGRWDKRWLAFAGVTACAGVLAKENAVMIVGFVLLYDFLSRWPLAEGGTAIWSERLKRFVQQSWPPYLAFLPAVLLITVIRQWIMSTTTVFEEYFLDNPLVGASWFQRLMTGIEIIGHYLKLLVFPRTLSSDYSFNQIPVYGTGHRESDVFAWLSLAVVAFLFGTAIYLRVRNRVLSWGILFFLIMMLPTSNLLVTIGSIMAERFLYLPSVGFSAAAAVVLLMLSSKLVSLADATGRSTSGLRWALPIIVVAALGVRTIMRNSDWQDDLAFWKSTIAASPQSYKAHMTYGNSILADAERNNVPLSKVIDDAIAQEETAQAIVNIEPPLPLKWQSVMVYLHLAKDYRMKGQFLDDSGRHNEAVQLYQKSLDILRKAQDVDRATNEQSHEFQRRRGIQTAQMPDSGNYLVYESLCFTYGKFGEWEKCESAAHYLQHIAPQQPSGYELLGAAYFNLGRFSEAAAELLAGFLLDPEKPDWLTSLAAVYDKMGVQPNPVAQQGTNFVLNKDLPFMRDQLTQAAALLVRLHQEAKKPDEARALQDRLVRQYSLAPEIFSRKS